MRKTMEHYGARFLRLDQLVAAAESVGVDTNAGELQILEEEGLLFPVRRIIKPVEFAEYFHRLYHDPSHPFYGKDRYEYDDKWEFLHHLVRQELPMFHAPWEKAHIHPFDREDVLASGFVVIPSVDNRRPWSDYTFKISMKDGNEQTVDCAEHYYSYWQVHDLFAIHKMVTLRVRVRPSRSQVRLFVHDPGFADTVYAQRRAVRGPVAPGDFLGADKLFEAVGRYLDASSAAQRDAINDRKDRAGYWMERDLTQRVHQQVAKAAKEILGQLDLSEKEMVEAVRTLANQFLEYEGDEKQGLAKAIRSDLRYALRLISDGSGERYDQLYARLADRCLLNHVFTDDGGDARKVAVRELRGCVSTFNAAFRPHVLKPEDCDAFVTYCTGDLEPIPWAISKLNSAYFKQEFRREREMFAYLGDLASGLESVVKTIVRPHGRISTSNLTLRPALRLLLDGDGHFDHVDKTPGLWGARAQFDAQLGITDFVSKYASIKKDCDAGLLAQSAADLLLTGLVRNYTSHESALPPDEFFLNDFVGPFHSVMRSLLLVWVVARKKNLA